MVTTLPDSKAPDAIGDVVTFSPSSNWLEPVILPVTELSRFFVQRLRVGTPRGAFVAVGTGTDLLAEPPPSPNNDMVLLGL